MTVESCRSKAVAVNNPRPFRKPGIYGARGFFGYHSHSRKLSRDCFASLAMTWERFRSLGGAVRRCGTHRETAVLRPAPVPGRCPGLHYLAPHKGWAHMSLRGAVRRRGNLSHKSPKRGLIKSVLPLDRRHTFNMTIHNLGAILKQAHTRVSS